MKKIVLLLVFASVGCSTKKEEPKEFMCFNPFSPIQSFQISTENPSVRESNRLLELTTQEGAVIIVPKSLCVEFKRPK